jgi:hypothetical protein
MGTIAINHIFKIGLHWRNFNRQINGRTLNAPNISKYPFTATKLNILSFNMGRPAGTFHSP